MQRLLHFSLLGGSEDTDPHSRCDIQTPSSPPPHSSSYLLKPGLRCTTSLKAAQQSQASVCAQRSKRETDGQTCGTGWQSSTAICYPHNHPIKKKKEERDVMDSAYTPERADWTGKGPVNEFWLLKSNDLPASWQHQFVLFSCRQVWGKNISTTRWRKIQFL